MADEVRMVDPKTGAEKGGKLERHDLIPAASLRRLATHYGVGAQKYAENNWRKGYAWSWSFAAMMRHAWAFWNGEDIDEETGTRHIVSAMWHCLVLDTFMDEQKDRDDRFKVPEQSLEELTESMKRNKAFPYENCEHGWYFTMDDPYCCECEPLENGPLI